MILRTSSSLLYSEQDKKDFTELNKSSVDLWEKKKKKDKNKNKKQSLKPKCKLLLVYGQHFKGKEGTSEFLT